VSLIETREPRRNSTEQALTTRLSHGTSFVAEPIKDGRISRVAELETVTVWVVLVERVIVAVSEARALVAIAPEPGKG